MTGVRFRSLFFLLSRYWIIFFGALMILYVGLPFLAPVFMQIGWKAPADVIYFIYAYQCHQMADRSFFLFGSRAMYAISDLEGALQAPINPQTLRQFIGNPLMGWKVAWSDRMVFMYTSTWLFGLLWWLVRHRINKLPWWGLALFLLPMTLDGGTHFISDLFGLQRGFRYDNAWLAALTQGTLSATFYSGNALGSFNSWARLLTGLSFGAGVVWFGFPYLDEWFMEIADNLNSATPNKNTHKAPPTDR